MMEAALQGVRVLDLTRMLPGNYCTWMMSVFGADVIKVEDNGAGDYMRGFGQQVDGQGAMNHLVNRGKRSIVVDLKSPEGIEVLHRLVSGADVLVESFRPGVMDRLGVGYEALRVIRPSLVYANISGFGVVGPKASAAGHDINYLAFSGLLDRLGPADGPPVVPSFAVSDLVGGGLNSVIAILALLVGARATGVGHRVDTALAEGAALMPSNLIADYLAGVAIPGRGRAEFGGGSGAYNVYALADGYVSVGAVEPKFWRTMCEILGTPELEGAKDDPTKDGLIRKRLGERFAAMTRSEASHLFEGTDTCVEVVQTSEEMLVSSQADAAGYLSEVPGLSMKVLAAPFLIDGARPPERRRAPLQGEDGVEILRDLGYSDERIDALMSLGVTAPLRAT